MQYTLEHTQHLVSVLGVHPPHVGGDQRHLEDATYPYLAYDDFTDNDIPHEKHKYGV